MDQKYSLTLIFIQKVHTITKLFGNLGLAVNSFHQCGEKIPVRV